MKVRKWAALVVLIVVLMANPVSAEETVSAEGEDQELTVLEPITVQGNKEGSIIKDVIPQEAIQIPKGSGSVLDALENQPGVQLRRSSLSGTDGSKLRLRGFDETRLRIMKDGVTLNRDGSYGNGPVDWSMLSTENVERIEIYRGAGPAKFGNTLGGVVNIVTGKPTEEPETALQTSYGSRDTWDSSVVHKWRAGPVGWVLSAGHFESDGYLRNNTVDRDNVGMLLDFALPAEWNIGLGLDYSVKENGNPVYNRPDSPYYDNDDPRADEKELGGPGISARLINGNLAWGDDSFTEDENLNFTAYLEKQMAKGHFRLDFRLWNQDRTEKYYDAANSSKKIYERETEAEDNNWSLQAAADYRFGGHFVEVGGETRSYGWGDQDVKYIDESYFNGSINFLEFIRNGFEGQPDIMAYHALYAQDTWTLHPKLSLEFGLRQEWYRADSIDPDAFGYNWPAEDTDIREDHLDPRVAVTFRPWESGALTARFGIAHRYPTSPEYFWWYLNNAAGFFNTDFGSEEAEQYELSYEQSILDRAHIILRGYYYDVEDYIASTTLPGIGSVYFNIGEVEIKGLELGASVNLPYALRVWSNFTWQEADKDDDPWDTDNELTGQLPDFPEKMFNAGIDYNGGRLNARLWLNYVDEREHFKGNQLVVLDDYTLVNAAVNFRIWEGQLANADLQVAVENLLDEDYEEEEGYPMPGTSVYAGIRFEF